MNENTRKIVSKTPYFKKSEENYWKSFEIPELERKKQILQSLRDLHQHIDFQAVEEEQREKEKAVHEKLQRLKEEREEEIRKRQEDYDPQKYRTDWQRELLEKEQAEREAKQKIDEYRKEKLEKMLSYDKMIKHQHKPSTSKRKHLEIEILKKQTDPSFIKMQREQELEKLKKDWISKLENNP